VKQIKYQTHMLGERRPRATSKPIDCSRY
jgi:hypothetical protein